MTEEHGVPGAWLVAPEGLASMGPVVPGCTGGPAPLPAPVHLPCSPTHKKERLSGLNLPSKNSTGNKIK